MVEELSSRGHRTSEEDTRGGAVYGISVRQTDDGVYYEANADYRKGGDVAGFWYCVILFSFEFEELFNWRRHQRTINIAIEMGLNDDIAWQRLWWATAAAANDENQLDL